MSYLKNLLIAIDQLGNAIGNGNPDETISSRVGRNAIAGKRWALIAEAVIDWIAFRVFGRSNCCPASIGAILAGELPSSRP